MQVPGSCLFTSSNTQFEKIGGGMVIWQARVDLRGTLHRVIQGPVGFNPETGMGAWRFL